MIVVVNLNLAVDHFLRVGDFAAGRVHRAVAARHAAGGKGVNVARVLRALGEDCVVAGFVGGAAGRTVERGLAAEGVALEAVRIRGESRTCVIVGDDASGEQTVVNEPGPEISLAELARFERAFARLAGAGLVVLTGSLPRGVPAETYARLVDVARASEVRCLVDCTGEALAAVLSATPFLVRVNADEAATLVTGAKRGPSAYAARLCALGAENAMVTNGRRNASFVYAGERVRLVPPRVETRNAVGSGDACMAGLAAGVVRGLGPEALGRLAVAAGTANALHGFGGCSRDEVLALRDRVRSFRSRRE